MEIMDNSSRNPVIIISADEVAAWLRTKADEAGFADRSMCAVQVTVEHPFVGGTNYHGECPKLVVMVSNIRDSRDPGQ
jgi:hypothetical protein